MGCTPSTNQKTSQGTSETAESPGSTRRSSLQAVAEMPSDDVNLGQAGRRRQEEEDQREQERLLAEMDILKNPDASQGNVCREPMVGRAVIATFLAESSLSTGSMSMGQSQGAGATLHPNPNSNAAQPAGPSASMPEGQKRQIQDWRRELDESDPVSLMNDMNETSDGPGPASRGSGSGSRRNRHFTTTATPPRAALEAPTSAERTGTAASGDQSAGSLTSAPVEIAFFSPPTPSDCETAQGVSEVPPSPPSSQY